MKQDQSEDCTQNDNFGNTDFPFEQQDQVDHTDDDCGRADGRIHHVVCLAEGGDNACQKPDTDRTHAHQQLIHTAAVLKFLKKIPARSTTVKVGVNTPRFATTAPGIPAAWMPANVAQFSPSGPGVISAMATMSETSLKFIHLLDTTSWVISGIMDRPPKLVKPIFIKLQKSLRSVRIMTFSAPFSRNIHRSEFRR